MKVVKNINNNTAICVDANGNELVAFGKGIGFSKPPYEVDLSKIERTYYNLNPLFISMIKDISSDALDISDKVVNYAVNILDCELNSNLILTLADHINFAIKRFEENMNITLSISNDIKMFYQDEIKIGEYALKLIKDKTGLILPKEEAVQIALHIINSEYTTYESKEQLDHQIVADACRIIEEFFAINIDKESFSYSRFVSHFYYLLRRVKDRQDVNTENYLMYKSLVDSFPRTNECVEKIRHYLKKRYAINLTDEECLYLILHVNRLCAREISAP